MDRRVGIITRIIARTGGPPCLFTRLVSNAERASVQRETRRVLERIRERHRGLTVFAGIVNRLFAAAVGGSLREAPREQRGGAGGKRKRAGESFAAARQQPARQWQRSTGADGRSARRKRATVSGFDAQQLPQPKRTRRGVSPTPP